MKSNEQVKLAVWSLLILLLVSYYVYVYYCLSYGLQTAFDEGFFFLDFKHDDVFTVQTKPLALSGELLKSLFPSIGEWDVLALRRVAFGMKCLSIILFGLCSSLFVFWDRQERRLSSFFVLVACVLLFGLFVIPCVVVNGNDLMLVGEMLVVSLCLLSVSVTRTWFKRVCVVAIGSLSFFATMSNPPGGAMLLLLAFLFLVLYNGYNGRKLCLLLIWLAVGLAMGLVVMSFCIISFRDALEFVRLAFDQTTNGTSASHHSLARLAVILLLNIRDLIMTLTMLCGITFICRLLQFYIRKKWLTIIVGIVLFLVMNKWQVKPDIKFASIITWVTLMSWIVCRESKKDENYWNNDLILVLFLYLCPLVISVGSNVGILYKVNTFIMPWGILIFILSILTNNSNKLFSDGLLVFVFAFVLYGPVTKLLRRDITSTIVFSKEFPISRMHLNENQSAFYNEVYDNLKDYNYKSSVDTILGFCFNEMTIVAVDAIPYSNDQYPEEFLLHDKDKLVKPSFMILSEWDEIVLSPFFETLDWDFPNSYDIIRLQNNPDPNSGWEKTQSSLYCEKSRRKMPERVSDGCEIIAASMSGSE